MSRGLHGLASAARKLEHPARVACPAERRSREPERLLKMMAHRPTDELERVRPRGGRPVLRRIGLGLAADVQQQGHQLDRSQAVDEAMMSLPDHADLAIVQLLGDPQLPQRAIVIERDRHDLVDQAPEIAFPRPAYVQGDVEVRVIDPDGVVETEGDLGQLLAVARRAAEAPLDVVADRLEARSRALRRRVEQRRPAEVHRRVLGLERQERGVQRGQPTMCDRGHARFTGPWAPRITRNSAEPRSVGVRLAANIPGIVGFGLAAAELGRASFRGSSPSGEHPGDRRVRSGGGGTRQSLVPWEFA